MLDAPLALAFTAGMVATVNPCGFAMLPAYLGYFLGLEGAGHPDAADTPATVGLVRALVVGAVVSAGFLILFALTGVLISWTSFSIGEVSPWLTVIIGIALVSVGIGFAVGWEPTFALPKLNKGGRSRGLWSMFLFGVSYAIASLSCTLPAFTGVVATTFSRTSFLSGVATFLAYGAGMALLLMVLTVGLALAQRGMVTRLQRALPYVQRVSGAIMALMGAYLVWYGIYEVRLISHGEIAGAGPVDLVTGWSSDLSERITQLDPVQVALVLALAVASVVLAVLLKTNRGRP